MGFWIFGVIFCCLFFLGRGFVWFWDFLLLLVLVVFGFFLVAFWGFFRIPSSITRKSVTCPSLQLLFRQLGACFGCLTTFSSTDKTSPDSSLSITACHQPAEPSSLAIQPVFNLTKQAVYSSQTFAQVAKVAKTKNVFEAHRVCFHHQLFQLMMTKKKKS